MLLVPHQLKTYPQVLSIAHDVEQGLEKKRRVELLHKPMKRQFQRVNEGIQSDLLVPQKPSGLFSLLLSNLCVDIVRSLDTISGTAVWPMVYVWHADPATTRWESVHSRRPGMQLQHHQHFQYERQHQHLQLEQLPQYFQHHR